MRAAVFYEKRKIGCYAIGKKQPLFFCYALLPKLLRSVSVLSNNLNTLVVATSLAYAVCAVVFTALGALNDVGGVLQLPNAGTSLHLSGMRHFSLRNCHVVYLLIRVCDNAFSLCEFYF